MVEKALWYVESHSCSEVRLTELAGLCGVSSTSLSRAFPLSVGYSLRTYLRRRRLAQAAQALADGAPDILAVALEWGYGSHEAFTRAFREEFGCTPQSVREAGSTTHLPLLEAIRMSEFKALEVTPVRLETTGSRLVAGFTERYENGAAGIPAQWQRFGPHLEYGQVAYGVCYGFGEGGAFDYLCGVEVREVPSGWASVTLPAGQWAVFRHEGHISTVQHTVHSIWSGWLPGSGYEAAEAPFFERYGPEFNGETGTGGLEIWLAITGPGS